MIEWRSAFISANGLRLHYTRTGGDGPVLVLVHGMTDNGLCWSRLARALETDYDVIMPDARSHGLSERSSSDYTSKELGDDLAGIIEGLHLDRPVVAGHSMGAMTTMFLAASYPHLLRAAILEDPPWRQTAPALTGAEHDARIDERRRAFAHEASVGKDELFARGRRDNPLWADEEFPPWLDSKMAVDTAAVPELSEHDPWRDALPHVECPTLLITGDPATGAIVTPEVAGESTQLLPILTVFHVAGAGHSIRREQFDVYVQVVRAFLIEHTEHAPRSQ